MSGADDSVYEQEEQVATRLVTDASELIEFTDVRTSDVYSAGLLGLCEYLRGKSISWGAVSYRFIKVFKGWADPEDLADFPSACVHMEGEGEFDYSGLTPKADTLADGRVIQLVSEFKATITLDVWCTNDVERTALSALVQDLIQPVDWMAGFRLILPHYHSAVCTYLPQGMAVVDSQESSGERRRLASFSIAMDLPQLRLVGAVPRFDPRLDLSAYEDSQEYAQAVST